MAQSAIISQRQGLADWQLCLCGHIRAAAERETALCVPRIQCLFFIDIYDTASVTLNVLSKSSTFWFDVVNCRRSGQIDMRPQVSARRK